MLSTYPTCGSIVLGTIKCHVSHGAGEGGDAMRYGAEDRGGAKPPLAPLFHPAWYVEYYVTFEALTEDVYQPSVLVLSPRTRSSSVSQSVVQSPGCLPASRCQTSASVWVDRAQSSIECPAELIYMHRKPQQPKSRISLLCPPISPLVLPALCIRLYWESACTL